METICQQGVGAVLTINANTEQVRRLYEGIPREVGMIIPPRFAHVTVLQYHETSVAVPSPEAADAIDRTEGRIHNFLGSLPLEEITLRAKEERLQPFGKHLGIALKNNTMIEYIRGGITDIVDEEMAIELDPDDIEPHMSAVKVFRHSRRSLLTGRRGPRVPRAVHVNGFRTGQRTIEPNQPKLSREHGESPRQLAS